MRLESLLKHNYSHGKLGEGDDEAHHGSFAKIEGIERVLPLLPTHLSMQEGAHLMSSRGERKVSLHEVSGVQTCFK